MTTKLNLHYQVLEIEPGVSKDDIRQAYKDLAKVWHPDRFPNDPRLQQKAEEKLKQINAAYDFLKSYQPSITQSEIELKEEESIEVFLQGEKLKQFLQLGNLKGADHETKRLLLELARREKEGWLRPEDIKNLPLEALYAIDQLWASYSNGRFGFSAQRKVWSKLGCNSSGSVPIQTMSENRFGQSVRWRVGSMWLTPWDSFNYDDIQAPQGSLPREYIFILSGWWSYSKGWTGYFLLRADDIFLRF